jgi:error-prone DNA polymerase
MPYLVSPTRAGREGSIVSFAGRARQGAVISAQRPPTARGTAFLALEDEGGLINVVLKQKVYEVSQKALKSPFAVAEGRLQRRGEAISVLAREVITLEASP